MVDIAVWTQQFAHHLQHHMDTEREVLRTYGYLAEGTTNEQVRYLINLVLDDEVRHHRLFQEMLNWLRAEFEGREDAGPRLPDLQSGDPADEALHRQTLELLELEREDLHELKDLRRNVAEVIDTAWWSVLIDSMELDTRKHIRVLEFIADLVKP